MGYIESLSKTSAFFHAESVSATSGITHWLSDNGVVLAATTNLTGADKASSSTPNGKPSIRFGTNQGWFQTARVVPKNIVSVTASSSYLTMTPYTLFCGNNQGVWSTASSTPTAIITTQYSSAFVATGVTLYARTDGWAAQAPANFTVEGSNNGSSWTVLHTVSGAAPATTGTTYSFSNSTPYLYYRLNVTAPVSATSVGLSQMDYVGQPVSTLVGSGAGEVWLVVRSDGGNNGSWGRMGTAGSQSHYPYAGWVYDDFGHSTRREFNPTMSITSTFRVLRFSVSSAGAWSAHLDNVQQLTASGVTASWPARFLIGHGGGTAFAGNIAAIVTMNDSLTSGEATSVYNQLVSEYIDNTVTGSVVARAPEPNATGSGTVTNLTTGSAASHAPASYASGSGTVTITSVEGAATAYAPPSRASGAGTAVVPVTGSATSRAPVGTASGAGTVPILGSGSAHAPLPHVTGSGAGRLQVTHTGSSTMTVTFSNAFVIGHTGTSTHDVDDMETVTTLVVDHRSALSSMSVKVSRPVVIDPVTGKAPYRLVVVDMYGTRFADLGDAKIGQYRQELNNGSLLEFTMKKTDPKISHIVVPKTEIQFWRGAVLEDWLVVVRAAGRGGEVTFTAVSLMWYFEQRVMGKVPIPNLLKNGSFEEKEKHWEFKYEATSIPNKAPAHEIVRETINGEYALSITGSSDVLVINTRLEGDANFAFDSSTLTSQGIANINAVCAQIQETNPKIRVEGHTDSNGSSSYNYTLGLNRANSAKAQILTQIPGAQVTTVSYGETRPIASNATSGGRAQNRRVEINYDSTVTAKGHKQYAGQSFAYTNAASNKKPKTLTLVGWMNIGTFDDKSGTGYGVYMQLVNTADGKVKAKTFVPLNEDTPRNRWVRMECSLEVPADDKAYRVDVRLYPPAGTCVWDEISVKASDALTFYGRDQVNIAKGLIEHAQDPAMGKSDLNIGTNVTFTKVFRTREYPWIERMQISEALAEWPTLADGFDMMFDFTPTTRKVRTFYPRKATRPAYVFALGANVADYSSDIDGTQTTTTVIVQAEGEGADREEGVYSDTSKMDGIVLEKVYNATPGSAISSLDAQAKRGVKRWSSPVILPELVMHPQYTEELLQTISLGDVVPVVVQDAWVNINSEYRIVGRSLDVEADQITYQIVPEVELT